MRLVQRGQHSVRQILHQVESLGSRFALFRRYCCRAFQAPSASALGERRDAQQQRALAQINKQTNTKQRDERNWRGAAVNHPRRIGSVFCRLLKLTAIFVCACHCCRVRCSRGLRAPGAARKSRRRPSRPASAAAAAFRNGAGSRFCGGCGAKLGEASSSAAAASSATASAEAERERKRLEEERLKLEREREEARQQAEAERRKLEAERKEIERLRNEEAQRLRELREREEREAAARREQAEREEAAKRRREEEERERKRQEDEAAAARKKREEDEAAARKKREAEAAAEKQRAEDEARKKREADEAEARRKREADEAARKKRQQQAEAEEQARKKREEEEAAKRKREEEEAAQRKRDEEEAAQRKRDEEAAAQRKRDEEAQKKRDEDAARSAPATTGQRRSVHKNDGRDEQRKSLLNNARAERERLEREKKAKLAALDDSAPSKTAPTPGASGDSAASSNAARPAAAPSVSGVNDSYQYVPGQGDGLRAALAGGSAAGAPPTSKPVADNTYQTLPVAPIKAVTLPPGWEEHETDDGEVYYYNAELDESSWTLPSGSGGHWTRHVDDNGDVYFYNPVTDESKWELGESEQAMLIEDDGTSARFETAPTSAAAASLPGLSLPPKLGNAGHAAPAAGASSTSTAQASAAAPLHAPHIASDVKRRSRGLSRPPRSGQSDWCAAAARKERLVAFWQIAQQNGHSKAVAAQRNRSTASDNSLVAARRQLYVFWRREQFLKYW